jgi:hypothetical protein
MNVFELFYFHTYDTIINIQMSMQKLHSCTERRTKPADIFITRGKVREARGFSAERGCPFEKIVGF